MRRASALVAFLVLAALAGCFGPKSSPVDVIVANPLLVAAPGRGGDFVVVASSTLAFKQTLPVHSDGLPKNWSLEIEKPSLDVPGQKRIAFIVHAAPGNNTTYGLHDFDIMIGDSRAGAHVFVDNLTTAASAWAVSAFASNGSVSGTSDAALWDTPGLMHGANATLLLLLRNAPCESGPNAGVCASSAYAALALRVGESHAARESDGSITLVRAVG